MQLTSEMHIITFRSYGYLTAGVNHIMCMKRSHVCRNNVYNNASPNGPRALLGLASVYRQIGGAAIWGLTEIARGSVWVRTAVIFRRILSVEGEVGIIP